MLHSESSHPFGWLLFVLLNLYVLAWGLACVFEDGFRMSEWGL